MPTRKGRQGRRESAHRSSNARVPKVTANLGSSNTMQVLVRMYRLQVIFLGRQRCCLVSKVGAAVRLLRPLPVFVPKAKTSPLPWRACYGCMEKAALRFCWRHVSFSAVHT